MNRLYTNLKLIFGLGVRNLWRQKRRNTVLLLAITIAIGGVIVLNSLIRGMQIQMIEQTSESLTGHILIESRAFRNDPWVGHGFNSLSTDEIDVLNSLPLVGYADRLQVPLVVRSAHSTRGVQLVGIDPEQENISFFPILQIEGKKLVDSFDKSILIGRSLLDQLQVRLNHRIVAIVQDGNGESTEIGYRVIGVFDAESEQIEKQYIFTGKHSLQELLSTSNITSVSLRFHSIEDTHEYVDRIIALYPDRSVRTWRQAEPLYGFMHDAVDLIVFIWLAIVLIALVFGLSNTFVTAILERKHEIGLLHAIGMRGKLILAQIIGEAMILMIVGIVLGTVSSALLLAWIGDGIDLSDFAAGVELMNLTAKLTPAVTLQDLGVVIGLSMVLAIVACTFPALRAVRMNPIDSLRE